MAAIAPISPAGGAVDPGQPAPVERLRILLAIEAAGGGTGRHVIDLAAGLLRHNHNVCLAYSPARAEPWFMEAVARLPGLSTHEVPMQRAVGIGDLRATLALRDLIERLGPFDILHAHSSKAGALLRLAAVRLATPVIYTPHAMVTMDPALGALKMLVYRAAERALAGLGARIICVSAEERAHAIALGLPAEHLVVVENGVQMPPASIYPDDQRRLARARLGLGEHEVCIGFVGRIAPQKAVDRLLSAFAMACHREPRLRLVIVGDGPDLQAMQTLARSLGISSRVVFTGSANGMELMRGFDVFALSSRFEGLPYVLLEAASLGLPLVMAETGGAQAMVREGENGFVVPQGQIEELAGRLATLASDGEMRRRMGAQSRQVAAEFSIERMVQRTVTVYADTLAGSSGRD